MLKKTLALSFGLAKELHNQTVKSEKRKKILIKLQVLLYVHIRIA
jgi:hypothetical protein